MVVDGRFCPFCGRVHAADRFVLLGRPPRFVGCVSAPKLAPCIYVTSQGMGCQYAFVSTGLFRGMAPVRTIHRACRVVYQTSEE